MRTLLSQLIMQYKSHRIQRLILLGVASLILLIALLELPWAAGPIGKGDFGGQASTMLQVVQDSFRQFVQTKKLSAIILDVPGWLESDLTPFYSRQVAPVFAASDVFWPVTDWRIRPTIIYLPNP